MKFSVTQKHIDHGEPRQIGYCALALCAAETLKVDVCATFSHLYVGRLYGSKTMFSHFVKLPPEASTFIEHFDECKSSVAPFEFELELETPK